MNEKDTITIRLNSLDKRQAKFWDENYRRSSCNATKTLIRIIDIAMNVNIDDSNEIDTITLKIMDKKERICFRKSSLGERRAKFWDENYRRSSCNATKTFRRIINIAMKSEKKREEKKILESKDVETGVIRQTSAIHSKKIVQQKETKPQRYKPKYPRYDFINMLQRIDKEYGFRKVIEKALYVRHLWTQRNINDFREYINNLRIYLKDNLNDNLIKAFITIEKILELEERAKIVIGKSLVHGGISIVDSYTNSKRIYGRYCYEKLFKEFGIPLPDALKYCRDEIIENREQLEQSGIFEDLINSVLELLGIDFKIQELINDYREGNLDHYGKTRLISKILTNEFYYSNHYYQKILNELKKERAN